MRNRKAPHARGRARRARAACLVGLAFLAPAGRAWGQMSPEEHASHHPGAGGMSAPMPGGAAAAPGGATTPAGPGGMPGMGNMMKQMGGTPPGKEVYPSLMGIPEFTPEKRNEVSAQADGRMKAGTALLAAGLDRLNQAIPASDFPAMQEATAQMREGLSQFESGVAARRALAEGQPPRGVALQWFRSEMSLSSPISSEEPRDARGLSFFHLFTMALLIAFSFAMLAMYFFKMRRAEALFGRIEPDAGSPPPGSSPPLGGGPGPAAPAGGTAPPGEKTPPASTGGPPNSSEPPDEKPAAPTPPPGVPSAAASTGSPAPLTAKWRGNLRVESIVRETPLVKTFRFRSPGGGALPIAFTPGQFLNVAFGIGGARMNRSYSISSSPNERDYVELTVKREERGAVSRRINDLLKVGDTIEAGGPVGKFTFTGTEADSIVLLSAGVGITPMACVARYLTERSWPGDIFFIYSCRTPADFIFEKALAGLARRNPKLHVVVTMSKPGPGWKGPRGRITKELLTGAVPDLASRRVHLCGPVPMMDAAKALLAEIGVSPDNLKTEQFGAVKPAPGAPGTSAKPTAPATGPLVTFSKNNKSAKIHVDLKTGDSPPEQTILELSEELGIGIEFSCRVGTCGVCKVKMTVGEVDMAVQDALDDGDKKSGVILACQAKPKTEVTVEA